ncbi:MAG TPA: hypothetical protein VMV10_21075 [Pirellulales bacterium]|nr:hypothetical protein [Pirellulales bacterium]
MPPAQCGVCVISVDFGNSGAARADADLSVVSAAAAALRRLNQARWAATWSLGRGIDSEWIDSALGESLGHELAILADDEWYSVANHRGRFSQALSDRLEEAHAAGYSPATLSLPLGHLAEHLDLLVKHGISAVRSTRVGESQGWRNWRSWLRQPDSRSVHPQSLRWGLWQFDGSLSLVQQGLRRVLQAISAAAAEGGLAHVVVGLDQLAAQGASGWRVFDRLLAHATELRERQALQTQTVRGVVASLSRTRQGAAAHSILRPAA